MLIHLKAAWVLKDSDLQVSQVRVLSSLHTVSQAWDLKAVMVSLNLVNLVSQAWELRVDMDNLVSKAWELKQVMVNLVSKAWELKEAMVNQPRTLMVTETKTGVDTK